MVLDSSSLTNFFSTLVQPLPVDLLSNGRRRLPLSVSAVPPLLSSVSLSPLSVVSLPWLTFSIPSPISFSLPPLPLFLLFAPPVVALLPPRVLPLPPADGDQRELISRQG